jgi:hypothetical protein
MAKRGEPAEEKPRVLSSYTVKLDDGQMKNWARCCVRGVGPPSKSATRGSRSRLTI